MQFQVTHRPHEADGSEHGGDQEEEDVNVPNNTQDFLLQSKQVIHENLIS